MADQTDIPAWIAGLTAIGAGIVGAIGAAIKAKKPPEKDGNDVLSVRVEDLERRQEKLEQHMETVFSLLNEALDKLSECRSDIREALTRLEERRK